MDPLGLVAALSVLHGSFHIIRRPQYGSQFYDPHFWDPQKGTPDQFWEAPNKYDTPT